jgi:hypothetical protein
LYAQLLQTNSTSPAEDNLSTSEPNKNKKSEEKKIDGKQAKTNFVDYLP